MWIIKCQFVGNQGTYTKEEENATTEEYAKMKYTRMLDKWAGILSKGTLQLYDGDKHNEIKLEYIQNTIELNNKNKKSKRSS